MHKHASAGKRRCSAAARAAPGGLRNGRQAGDRSAIATPLGLQSGPIAGRSPSGARAAHRLPIITLPGADRFSYLC